MARRVPGGFAPPLRLGLGLSLALAVVLLLASPRAGATAASAVASSSACSAARAGPDPCLPHGKTNILTGKCGDAGSQNPTLPNTSCYTCYEGDTCQSVVPQCTVVEECGWPIMFSEIWGRYPCPNGEPVAHIPSDFGLAYQFFESDSTLLKALDTTIREVHTLVGNADPEGYHILPGMGGTGAALSLMGAFARLHGSEEHKIQVFSQAPCFFDYKDWPRVADEMRMEWNPDADPRSPLTLELLNSPANPSGEIRTARVGNTSLLICDFVYDWPYIAKGAVQTQRCDVMVYSMSKMTGHAGTRFGWALVKDKQLYDTAVDIMIDQTLGISVDTQVRVNTLLRSVIDTKGDFFKAGRAEMVRRWATLRAALSGCGSLVAIANSEAQGPNAWLRTPNGTNATATLLKGGLLGVGGEFFGASPNFVRFNLLDSNSTMDLIIGHLGRLCKQPPSSVLVPLAPGHPHTDYRWSVARPPRKTRSHRPLRVPPLNP